MYHFLIRLLMAKITVTARTVDLIADSKMAAIIFDTKKKKRKVLLRYHYNFLNITNSVCDKTDHVINFEL